MCLRFIKLKTVIKNVQYVISVLFETERQNEIEEKYDKIAKFVSYINFTDF